MQNLLKISIAVLGLNLLAGVAVAQTSSTFTRADTLRGAMRIERAAYDVVHYDLDLELLPATKGLRGRVQIAYRGVAQSDTIQLDLHPNLQIRELRQGQEALNFRRESSAVFVGLSRATRYGVLDTLTIAYEGTPIEAVRAPWDGGLTWSTDSLGRAWVAVSCEGIGASTWWPNKDHLSDEPDSVRFSMTVPDPLRVVSNGLLQETSSEQGKTRYTYAVTYPINNYNVTFYAGHYLSFEDTLRSSMKDSPLALRYHVLDYNLQRARRHFKQVKPMLRCYESLLGPYPFWNDGYVLVEAPYLGMEHQSAIAYGNNYMRGYRGGMIPADMDWDYLIVHESGHEYFGNALSVSDHAEMWLHESFTTYLEALYVECRYGREAYQRYLLGQRGFLKNEQAIVGPVGVNYGDFGSSDHYFKGSWVLHTFRSLVGDDAFLGFLRDFYEQYAIGTVTTSDWMHSVQQRFGVGYESFWRQYLYQPALPKLRISAVPGGSLVWFEEVIPGFTMELRVGKKRAKITDTPQKTDLTLADWEQFEVADYLLAF